jgi:hypothetical protein
MDDENHAGDHGLHSILEMDKHLYQRRNDWSKGRQYIGGMKVHILSSKATTKSMVLGEDERRWTG